MKTGSRQAAAQVQTRRSLTAAQKRCGCRLKQSPIHAHLAARFCGANSCANPSAGM